MLSAMDIAQGTLSEESLHCRWSYAARHPFWFPLAQDQLQEFYGMPVESFPQRVSWPPQRIPPHSKQCQPALGAKPCKPHESGHSTSLVHRMFWSHGQAKNQPDLRCFPRKQCRVALHLSVEAWPAASVRRLRIVLPSDCIQSVWWRVQDHVALLPLPSCQLENPEPLLSPYETQSRHATKTG